MEEVEDELEEATKISVIWLDENINWYSVSMVCNFQNLYIYKASMRRDWLYWIFIGQFVFAIFWIQDYFLDDRLATVSLSRTSHCLTVLLLKCLSPLWDCFKNHRPIDPLYVITVLIYFNICVQNNNHVTLIYSHKGTKTLAEPLP